MYIYLNNILNLITFINLYLIILLFTVYTNNINIIKSFLNNLFKIFFNLHFCPICCFLSTLRTGIHYLLCIFS